MSEFAISTVENGPSGSICAREVDPRILRSRQMLHDALIKLLEEKEFDKISIQEIADLATLNRATFYAHYPDKFALLQCVVGNRFHELMALRNVRIGDCSGALKALSLGVCDFLEEMPGAHRYRQGQVESNIQNAIVAVTREILLDGLRRHGNSGAISIDVLASTLAWAIYGAAHTWVSTHERCTAAHMAEAIDTMLTPVMHMAGLPVGSATA